MREDDEGTGPGEKPPEDDDIQIEFVDHEEPPQKPVLRAVSPPHVEPETGIVEIDVDAEEAAARERAEAMAQLQETAATLQDKLLRSRAEFENYKKRADREREEMGRGAVIALVKEILPVLDSLDRAVNTLETEAPPEWCKGLELVRQQFAAVLAKNGIERIGALGQVFDPGLHEAVMTADVPEAEPGSVTSVLEEGYLMGGRLVRPARVVVNRRPEQGRGEGGPDA